MLRKRVVITIGDARVGKSTTSRLLVELYLKHNLNMRVYYHGHRNKLDIYAQKNLKICYLGFSQGDSDQLLVDLEIFCNTTDVLLTDMPGQNFPEFKVFEKSVFFLENLNALGYRVTFLHPLSNRKDCVEYLRELYQYFGNQADYVVLKNYYFGKNFKYYDGGEVQKEINALKGIELVLGKLSDNIYQSLEDSKLPYSEAIKPTSYINVIYRSIIFNWMNNFHSLVSTNETAASYLGLTMSRVELSPEQKVF